MQNQILKCLADGVKNLMYTTGTYTPMTHDDWDKVEQDTARALCCNLSEVRKVTARFK